MRQSIDDDLESRLRELFERQAAGVDASARVWDDAPMVAVDELAARRRSRPRSALLAVVAVAASVLLVIGIVAAAPGRDGVRVGGQPGTGAPVHFETQQVRFDANSLRIDANGKTFTSAGTNVDVHSDPGTTTYQTLELDWQEHGVEMRLYFYFGADAHFWWVSNLATYNGRSQPDWIGYRGPLFRTPLGSAFAGDVDLVPDGAPSGARLHIAAMRLQPFLPPKACANQTGAYAIESNEGAELSLIAAPDAAFSDTVTLYDRATCAAVSTPGRFTYRFTSSKPEVVSVNASPPECPDGVVPANYCDTHAYLSLAAKSPGRATVHIEAVDTRSRAVVATLDVPVTAKA
jgi:hypothetical protein